MSNEATTIKFTAGQKVATRSAGDHNCIFRGEIVKRTPKTVVVKTGMRGERRCKIHVYEGVEFIYPFGQYSMAATFRADSPEDLRPDWEK